MGDMNINTLEHSSSLNKLTELCDTLGFQNLIRVGTCEMKGSSTCSDLILTNCKHNFKHTHAFETGLKDFHKMVTTCFKNTYERLRPINIQYWSYKNFDRDTFLSDLQAVPFEEAHSLENRELAYEKFKMLYSEVVEKHAPIKHKVLRGNQAPFITRDLSKQIMAIRSRPRNKFNKHKTTENWKAYKFQRNKCISMRRNNIRKHFFTLSSDTGAPTKKFWDSVKPFLNDKGSHGNENYSLIEDGKLIKDERRVSEIFKDERRVSEIFNDHYMNIVEDLTGEKQEGSHTGSLKDKIQNERHEILMTILLGNIEIIQALLA